MRVIFMGTPHFAAECLDALIKSEHEVVGVISQPDKPKNRGQQMLPTPVKVCAEEAGIDVYQPESLKDNAILSYLEEKKPDAIAVVAYGKILPEYILNFPKNGCINIHASLLPKYRGAAPIQHSILNGDKITGVTAMYMDKGMDTGDMILKEEVAIDVRDTSDSLHKKLSKVGAALLCKTLDNIENGIITREKQDDALATYAPMITKEMGKINWQDTAEKIVCQIHGLYPWPAAFSFCDGKRFKITEASVCEKDGKPGEILEDNKEIIVAAGKGSVKIEVLQFENKKAMPAEEFLKGNKCMARGVILGE